ncbi:MAG: A/G-specific adenine glycosylase, partial [Verrucomicrobiota bacterium]
MRTEAIFNEVLPCKDSLDTFQRKLIEWFRECGEDYPWRQTRDPYKILVSELMLQQTQIATVLGRGYFTRWLESFPDWQALADASEEEILKAWEGLGYYNRARNLWRAAVEVSQEYDGKLPGKFEVIHSLPGVGRYTAGAVLSFAFGQRAPIVDGNVVRVLSRLFGYTEPVDTSVSNRLLWDLADRLTPDCQVR